MADTPTPIVVNSNAGALDGLQSLGRSLLLIFAAVPTILTLLGAHDLLAVVNYFRGSDGAALLGAVVTVATVTWAFIKAHKRGAQVAAVAADPRVPDAVATTK